MFKLESSSRGFQRKSHTYSKTHEKKIKFKIVVNNKWTSKKTPPNSSPSHRLLANQNNIKQNKTKNNSKSSTSAPEMPKPTTKRQILHQCLQRLLFCCWYFLCSQRSNQKPSTCTCIPFFHISPHTSQTGEGFFILWNKRIFCAYIYRSAIHRGLMMKKMWYLFFQWNFCSAET